ncbi:ATP-binding protein [Motilibacter aurantiacus]|uniref:ATP-binding protein n=1 Tax=Motilibacter aurantiacus TaxID=2714955 RepID=UPI002F2B7884|nr:ATP-binding protein [Motilibacter aurantiacus]
MLRLAPDASAVGTARRVVAERLRAAGLESVVADAQLAVSELVANAVIHARTDVTVRVELLASGARIFVHDESPTLPTPAALGTTAMSGRGLVLVDAVSARWGVEPDPAGGKTVWFDVDPDQPAPEAPAPLLAMWLDLEEDEPQPADDDEATVVLPDVPVEALLAAKMRVEDLIRDLRLVLLDSSSDGRHASPEEVALAQRLDAAVQGFDRTRVQMRSQALQASARGEQTTTLYLLVNRNARDVAVGYREALEEADALSRSGKLLVGADLSSHAQLRRWYLDEIVRQLGEEHPSRPPTAPPGVSGDAAGQAALRDQPDS